MLERTLFTGTSATFPVELLIAMVENDLLGEDTKLSQRAFQFISSDKTTPAGLWKARQSTDVSWNTLKADMLKTFGRQQRVWTVKETFDLLSSLRKYKNETMEQFWFRVKWVIQSVLNSGAKNMAGEEVAELWCQHAFLSGMIDEDRIQVLAFCEKPSTQVQVKSEPNLNAESVGNNAAFAIKVEPIDETWEPGEIGSFQHQSENNDMIHGNGDSVEITNKAKKRKQDVGNIPRKEAEKLTEEATRGPKIEVEECEVPNPKKPKKAAKEHFEVENDVEAMIGEKIPSIVDAETSPSATEPTESNGDKNAKKSQRENVSHYICELHPDVVDSLIKSFPETKREMISVSVANNRSNRRMNYKSTVKNMKAYTNSGSPDAFTYEMIDNIYVKFLIHISKLHRGCISKQSKKGMGKIVHEIEDDMEL